MNIKDLFNTEKRETLLQDAVKKARAKKGGEFPFAFAMMGNKQSLLVLDWRSEFQADKLIKQMRKERPRKMIVGTASINGKQLELKVEQSKGTVKAKDVREYLAKSGLPINKAVIRDQGSAPQNEPDGQRRGKERGKKAALVG